MNKPIEDKYKQSYETPSITDIPSLSTGLILHGTSGGEGGGAGEEEEDE
jgi:hypothetical protein